MEYTPEAHALLVALATWHAPENDESGRSPTEFKGWRDVRAKARAFIAREERPSIVRKMAEGIGDVSPEPPKDRTAEECIERIVRVFDGRNAFTSATLLADAREALALIRRDRERVERAIAVLRDGLPLKHWSEKIPAALAILEGREP